MELIFSIPVEGMVAHETVIMVKTNIHRIRNVIEKHRQTLNQKMLK